MPENYKLIDCFMFYNELDLLKFRLEYLYNIVDKFVLVECTLTHSGDAKQLYYEENKHLFEKYNHKIIHIVVADLPDKNATHDAWVRETTHRNCIDRGLQQIQLTDQDIIVICDLDEIPDRNTLQKLKSSGIENKIYALEQDLYYYNLTCRAHNKWYHTKVTNYYTYKTMYNSVSNTIRLTSQYQVLENGGWHFSYFGDINFIKNKIQHFAHQEFNKDKYLDDTKIMNQIKTCGDLYFRDSLKQNNCIFGYCDINDNKYLPENYEDLLKFSELYKT